MIDRRAVVRLILKEYLEKMNIEPEDEGDDFSRCAVDLIVSGQSRNQFDIDNVFTEGSRDTGIDGLAITVNHHVIHSVEEFNSHLPQTGAPHIRFIFVQATLNKGVRKKKIKLFSEGVADFFREQTGKRAQKNRNQKIETAAILKNVVMQRIKEKSFDQPEICLHYVWTGRWGADDKNQDHKDFASDIPQQLKALKLFSKCDFQPVDGFGFMDLQHTFRKMSAGIINSKKLCEVPSNSKIQKTYVGSIRIQDVIELVRHPEYPNKINQDVFLENVRVFLGEENNAINCEIAETLKGDRRHLMSVMSNGLTVVCRDLEEISGGQSIRLYDYQIVNGGQTSNLIFEHREFQVDPEEVIPVKIIVCNDELLISKIVKAVNRQNSVSEAANAGLLAFNRRLKNYYIAEATEDADGDGDGEQPVRLYYRLQDGAGQNGANRNVPLVDQEHLYERTIDIAEQMKCFIAMVMRLPEENPDGLKPFYPLIPDQIFNYGHAVELYYASALCLHKFHDWRKRNWEGQKKPLGDFRYYFLFILGAWLFGEVRTKNQKSQARSRYDKSVRALLLNDDITDQLFDEALKLILQAGGVANVEDLSRGMIYSEKFRATIEELLPEGRNSIAALLP